MGREKQEVGREKQESGREKRESGSEKHVSVAKKQPVNREKPRWRDESNAVVEDAQPYVAF
jgi:hypothetical protein